MNVSAARGIPTTLEDCIAVVRSELSVRLGGAPLSPDVDVIAAHEVERLWSNPIKTFIPVLATRAAWEALARASSQASAGVAPAMMTPNHIRTDLMLQDSRDVIRFQDRDRLIYDDRDLLIPD